MASGTFIFFLMFLIESVTDMVTADRVCDRVGRSVDTGDEVADIDEVANRGVIWLLPVALCFFSFWVRVMDFLFFCMCKMKYSYAAKTTNSQKVGSFRSVVVVVAEKGKSPPARAYGGHSLFTCRVLEPIGEKLRKDWTADPNSTL